MEKEPIEIPKVEHQTIEIALSDYIELFTATIHISWQDKLDEVVKEKDEEIEKVRREWNALNNRMYGITYNHSQKIDNLKKAVEELKEQLENRKNKEGEVEEDED